MIGRIKDEVLDFAKRPWGDGDFGPEGQPLQDVIFYLCDVLDRDLGYLERRIERLERRRRSPKGRMNIPQAMGEKPVIVPIVMPRSPKM